MDRVKLVSDEGQNFIQSVTKCTSDWGWGDVPKNSWCLCVCWSTYTIDYENGMSQNQHFQPLRWLNQRKWEWYPYLQP